MPGAMPQAEADIAPSALAVLYCEKVDKCAGVFGVRRHVAALKARTCPRTPDGARSVRTIRRFEVKGLVQQNTAATQGADV